MQTVSFSEIDTMKQCPQKWQLAYPERWSAPFNGTNALAKGSCFHIVMEVHFKALQATQGEYRNSAQDADRLAYAVSAAQARIDEMRMNNEYPEDTIKLAEWMYVGYVERYGIDKDWRIMQVESTHVVPFYYPDGKGGWVEDTEFNLKVKLDLMVTDTQDRLWIVDHKSGGKVPSGEKDFQWADQFGLYEYAMKILEYRVTGTIHNAVLSKPNKGDLIAEGDPEWKSTMKATDPEKRMKRTFMGRTTIELRMIQWDALCEVRERYRAEVNQRRPDEERCGWRCSYNDACSFGRRNGEENTRLHLIDTGFTQEFARH